MHNRNKEIARRFMGAWDAGGAHVIDELAAPDFVVRYSPSLRRPAPPSSRPSLPRPTPPSPTCTWLSTT